MIKTLSRQFAKPGKLIWIGLRPGKKKPMVCVQQVLADKMQGLIGDRYAGKNGKRQVTLMQWEHIGVIESLTGQTLPEDVFRRNLIVDGINLLALKDMHFQIGEAVLQGIGLCHPCSRMEQALGKGGYNAMRGHGGLTARIIENGIIKLGDLITPLSDYENGKI